MPNLADRGIVETLMQLPVVHRNFLFDKFHGQMPETNRIEPKLNKLATILGPSGILPYQDLYLHKGGLLTWYVFRPQPSPENPDENPDKESTVELTGTMESSFQMTTHQAETKLLQVFPGIDKGIKPRLQWDADPVLYHMRRKDDRLILDFAALDAERSYFVNFKYQNIRYDRYYVIILRDNPFAIEIRSAYGRIPTLYRVVSEALGVRLEEGTQCVLDEEKRTRLKINLESSCFFAEQRHSDQILSSSSMKSHPGVDLENSEPLQEMESKPGVSGFSRTYEFMFHHENDGYNEHCTYRVKLINGEVRVESDMSEPAVRMLQKHVVALF